MKKFRSYIAGILTGALLFSLPVVADSVKEMIEVYFNTVTVTVDGKKVEADNILYNGRTYVPLRAISEITGKTVDWDDATKTADIHDTYGVTYSGEVVGNVGGKEITKEQLDTYVSIVKVENVDKNLDESALLEKAKEKIAYDVALENYAKGIGLKINKQFEDEYAAYMQYMSTQYPQFTQILQMVGYTEKSYKQVWQSDYLTQMVIGDAPASFMATEEEMKAYYDTNKEEFKYDGLKAKHILISTKDENGNPLTDEKQAELKKVVDEIYNQIKNGADFDALMNEFGEDPGVESNPDGYVFTKGDMVKEFEDTAYALEIGQVSEPVLSDYGYHIIKLVDKIEYLPYDMAKETILTELSLKKVEDVINMLVPSLNVNWN
ncbi:MAG: hypothetical protein E7391_01015 [Ruminococcaceae bacterium]|nr:hypothetical protein [Oscillospiraceae bacterium]